MKKLLTIISLVIVLTLTATTVFARTFSDIGTSSKYREAIEFVTEQGIVGGYEDGTYQPEKTLNRAELLKMTIEANYDDSEINKYTSKKCFSDIREDSWYEKYVCFAKNKGIIDGYDDGTFRPTDDINTVEALKITINTLGYQYENHGGAWYEGIVKEASNRKLLSPDITSFSGEFNRGQMADLVTRTVKEKEETLDVYLEKTTLQVKTYEMIENNIDVSEASWGWKLATTPEDAHNFINGLGGYSEPHAVQSIAGTEKGFYLFYRSDLQGSNNWGWKLAGTTEDAHNFLNDLGAYAENDSGPIANALIAHADRGYYIFYNGKDENADWGIKKSTDIDDMYDYFNKLNDYPTQRNGILAGSSNKDISMFYNENEEIEKSWGWKKATNTSDAYNFLNGFGAYGEALENVRIFAANSNEFYIFYNRSGSTSINTTTTPSTTTTTTTTPTAIANPPTCKDSDGGKDLYTKGKLNAYTPKYGDVVVYEYCVDSNGARTEDGGYVEELVCLDNNDEYAYIHERAWCANGCSDGACIKDEDDEDLMTNTDPLVYSIAVNNYPEHKDSSQSENMTDVYLNVYNVVPVSKGNYQGILRETIHIGDSKSAKVSIEYGEIVQFTGFKELVNAEAATTMKFSAPPNKHFGYEDKICQINYLVEDEIMVTSYGDQSCSTSASTPYQD